MKPQSVAIVALAIIAAMVVNRMVKLDQLLAA